MRETVPDRSSTRPTRSSWSIPTADDLLQRLREGKVYVKAQAERALKHFFQPGNLTALRELALRKAAQHVDRDMVDYMQAHAIGGPWAAGERILACINEHPSSAELVRRGAAAGGQSQGAEWTALYVEGPRHLDAAASPKKTASPIRCGWRSAWARRRVMLPGRDIAARIAGLCPAQERHADHDRQVGTARAGSSCCMARWCAS